MISVIGISHHTAPLDLRERFAISNEALPARLEQLRQQHGAAVLLSTCNRTELYLSVPAPEPNGVALRKAFNALGDASANSDSLYVYSGREAAEHLLRVASGLDSMVLGEDQILGQVRTAFMAASVAGATDRLLSRLFHLAIATGRRVRTETSIGRYAVSVSAVAVDAVRSRRPDLRNATVLVISAGEAGKLTARSVAGVGPGRLLVLSRTFERAQAAAASVGGVALDASELSNAVREADVIISASASPGYQVTRELLREARGQSPKLLLIVDIAVPRDVEPSVASEPDVELLDIDTLARTESDGAEQFAVVVAAERIVDQEVARLATWWDTLRVVPTISALCKQAENIRRREVDRTFGRLHNLTPEERNRIEALTSAIVNKMLHHPITRLKQPGAGERYAAVVHELFDLPVPSVDLPAASNE